MKLSSIAILIVTVVLNGLIWTRINKPYNLVETSYPIHSFSLNPYQKDQSPLAQRFPSDKDLERDIKVLAAKTHTVRLYSSANGLEKVPAIAKKYGMNVIASAFLDQRRENNELEVAAVIDVAKANPNVTEVIIGNETQLYGSVPREDLIAYLQQARQALDIPVTTAEPWDFWIQHPDFADNVDYIAIHVLPYWVEEPIETAVTYTLDRYTAVARTFPNKAVMIAETGWPSDGPQRGAAQASQANQALFVRDFIRRAEARGINYNIIEAFDQPWKSATEGRVGEHWGIMDADRRDKFAMSGPVLEDPKWKYWALSSTIIGFLAISLFLFRRHALKLRGQIFSVVMFQSVVAIAIQLARSATNNYMSPGDILFWTVMVAMQLLLAIIMLTDAVEIADVVGDKPLKYRFLPSLLPLSDYPMVSLHLACCKEPPAMVIATLDSLAALDYPNFEVIVVDNNTLDAALWKPVEAHCKALGARFRFYSLGQWPGFKAGALNFALKETHPDARVVGVVDADYIVKSDWLKATIPYFADAQVAVVQAPQEHRDWEGDLFRRMENDEYSGFFRIGMVQRNEHNAIIQHGTMTLIDRKTLVDVDGWAEWCICEDSELGLRILALGKKAIYLDHAFGHGLVPDNYEAYAKQRFRWAYGGMRILRGHWRELLGRCGQLSRAQRYQFVKGWLPWIGDALHMVFTLAALVWSLKLVFEPLHTDFPEPIFLYPAFVLVTLRISGTLWTYATRVKIGKRRTALAMLAGSALTHKVAKAVWQGLLGFSQPFYRTPKMDVSAPVIKALLSVREELALAIGLNFLAVEILKIFGTINFQAVLWSIALVIQSFPYLAAVAASLISSVAGSVTISRQMAMAPKGSTP